MCRFLYGFKIPALIRAWRERRKGRETELRREYVDRDGKCQLVVISPAGEKVYWEPALYAAYETWPGGGLAWVVYSREKGGE